MHKIFVTEGLVLGKRALGEDNTQVVILTRELGLVKVLARSARRERSKLRYGLEPLTWGRYSLLRGKYEWKLVGSERSSRDYFALGLDGSAGVLRRRSMGRVGKLLLRLLSGEEHTPQLFEIVSQGFSSLAEASSDGEAESIECILVLRILSRLGYLPHTTLIAPFVESTGFPKELALNAVLSRTLLVRAINESLGASGL